MEFNDDEYVDVNLEGTSKTGFDWYTEYQDLGGSKSMFEIWKEYAAPEDMKDVTDEEYGAEFFGGTSYSVLVDDILGTPEELVKKEEQPGFTEDEYIDPETNLETGYDEDFTGVDESCCGGKKKTKKKSKFVPFWAKKKSKEVDEAVELLRNAGYLVE